MKLPKTFRPEKNLDEKVEKLTDGYQEHIDKFEAEQKILDLLSKFDLNRGILYTGINPLMFEQSNLPYEKIIYLGIACNKLFENFYRYRFNYYSKGEGLKWLEIIDTRPFKPDKNFEDTVNEILNYYKNNNISVVGYRSKQKVNNYELKFSIPHTKKELIDVVNNFYCKKFPYLGSKYNLLINKLAYKGLTEDEFIHSNLPIKRIEIKWKNKKGI